MGFYYILNPPRKTCLKRPVKNRQNRGLNKKWEPNEGQMNCRMLPLEHSAILLTFIKLPFVIKIIVFWLLLTGHFTQVLLYTDVWYR